MFIFVRHRYLLILPVADLLLLIEDATFDYPGHYCNSKVTYYSTVVLLFKYVGVNRFISLRLHISVHFVYKHCSGHVICQQRCIAEVMMLEQS